MELTFAPRGILQINDARIVHRNFSGAPSKYNRSGDRNFSLVIPSQELAEKLREDGWNVKIKPPREEGDTPFMYLPVKANFNDRGPNIYLKTGRIMNRLNEDNVGCLDRIDIASVDLDIRPYDWEMDGETGRSAYLQGMRVHQQIDRFAAQYTEELNSDEVPFN